jgi:hypothetical protein
MKVSDAYKTLVGNHEGKRPLERPRHRWDPNIETYLLGNRIGGCGSLSGSEKELVTESCELSYESFISIKR